MRKHIKRIEKKTIIDRQNNICPFCNKFLIVGVFRDGPILSLRTMRTRHGTFLTYIHDYEFHHVVPISQGGVDDISNIQAVHTNCHLKIHGKRIAAAAVS